MKIKDVGLDAVPTPEEAAKDWKASQLQISQVNFWRFTAVHCRNSLCTSVGRRARVSTSFQNGCATNKFGSRFWSWESQRCQRTPLGNGGVWAEIGQAHPIRGLRTRQNYRNLPLFCWCCAFALPECSRGQCTPLVVASAVGHFDLSQVLKQVVQQSGLHKAMHHVS